MHTLRFSRALLWLCVAILGMSLAPSAVAGMVTSIKVTNNTGLSADDLEMSFAGTGGITNAAIVANPAGAGAANISFLNNGITILWGAPGLPNAKTIEFTITSASVPPDLSVLSAIWTFKNNQNGGTNNPIDVPSQYITLTPVPEPSSVAIMGIGLLALAGWRSRVRHRGQV